MSQNNTFIGLVARITDTDQMLKANAYAVINRSVTARAWLTGMYIVEYEQKGQDRAQYGENLLKNLSERLGGKSFGVTSLKMYRKFYLLYPQLSKPLVQYILSVMGNGQQYGLSVLPNQKSQTLSDQLQLTEIQKAEKSQTLSDQFGLAISQPAVGESAENQQTLTISRDGFAMRTLEGEVEPVPQMLFERLSYSHITLLLHVDNPLKRSFLAIEAMRGPWSVRELKRQIDSNYFERSGWSQKPELLSLKVNATSERPTFAEDLKSPYTFEFLGLSSKDTISEDDIEDALVRNFEDFIMELGMGFCLEARQKKMLIDDEYKKADLVFYHRILKCHVIVELKAHELEYGDVMQLNMYIEYYRKHYMEPDDNPPIGLLLCTAYGKEMAEYLKPFTDPQLFIAKYELQLPAKEKIQQFLMRENTIKR